tara:strand:+ start:1099 stop:1794 length:696 start_codon:yes stop_codon:yes gene_type:complete
MPRSINKKKIYFYLFILLFLSTTFNFSFVENIRKSKLLNKIDIEGLNKKEQEILKNELSMFLNKNIFLLDESEILKKLDAFKFFDKVYIQKILPSTINVLVKKTRILGITYIDGKKYFVGKNGKLIPSFQIDNIYELPTIFGNFSVSEFLILQNIFKKNQIDINKIKKYFYHKNKRWDLEDVNGITIMLPSKKIVNSLKIYNSLIENNKIEKLRIIDLRIPNQIVLTHEEK